MAKNSSQVRAQNKKTLVKRIRSRWQLYLLLLLPLAWLIIFAYVPMGGLVIAFKKYNVRQGIWGSEWVGLKNFEKFFKSVKCYEKYIDNFIIFTCCYIPYPDHICTSFECNAGTSL